MDISFWAATDPGRVRDINEDNFLVDKSLNLFVVCDGMGGHAAGEIASSAAARIVRDVLAANSDVLDRAREQPGGTHRKDVLTLLEFAVRDACARIHKLADNDSGKRGMGTTLSMLVICGRRGFVAHVGDSRIFLMRQKQPHQLTEDHSLVNELIKRGRLTEDEIADLPIKNAVTRAVGVYETVDVDTHSFDLLPRDRFLICSDGLHNYFENEVPPPGLIDIEDASAVPRRCIDFANRGGGKDNITAILVAVGEDTDEEHSRRFQLAMNLLRDAEPFQHLSFKELNRVMGVALRREVHTGAWLAEPGSEPALHIVLTGAVEAERDGHSLARIEVGRWFGLAELVGGPRADVRYRAEKGTTLLTIPRREFFELLSGEPRLAAKLFWNMMQLVAPSIRVDALLSAAAEPKRSLEQLFAPRDDSDEVSVVSSLLHTAAGDDLDDLTDDAMLIESSSGQLPRVVTAASAPARLDPSALSGSSTRSPGRAERGSAGATRRATPRGTSGDGATKGSGLAKPRDTVAADLSGNAGGPVSSGDSEALEPLGNRPVGRRERPTGRVKPMPGRPGGTNAGTKEDAGAERPAWSSRSGASQRHDIRAATPRPPAPAAGRSPGARTSAEKQRSSAKRQRSKGEKPGSSAEEQRSSAEKQRMPKGGSSRSAESRDSRASTKDRFARLRSMLARQEEKPESDATVTIVDSLSNIERLQESGSGPEDGLKETVKDEEKGSLRDTEPGKKVTEDKTVRMVSPYQSDQS